MATKAAYKNRFSAQKGTFVRISEAAPPPFSVLADRRAN